MLHAVATDISTVRAGSKHAEIQNLSDDGGQGRRIYRASAAGRSRFVTPVQGDLARVVPLGVAEHLEEAQAMSYSVR